MTQQSTFETSSLYDDGFGNIHNEPHTRVGSLPLIGRVVYFFFGWFPEGEAWQPQQGE